MDNDDLFPKPRGSKELRALLRQIDGDDSELARSPLYSTGYQDGFVMGKKEAQEDAKCIIRAITKLYDNTDDVE